MAQGMYAKICLAGTQEWVGRKMTITTEAITATVYENVMLFDYTFKDVDRAWLSFTRHMGYDSKPITKEEFTRDLKDLFDAVSQVDKTTFVLGCGTKVMTYCVGEPIVDPVDGFLEMSWERELWWTENPHISPIVDAIQVYYPDFKPWLGKGDILLAHVHSSTKSSLLPR